jgi:tetratricopeptide (TPR) repeat protein
MGEAFLREGKLEEAEQRLTNSLKTSEKILGSNAACTWQAKVYRAEVRFRLGKLDLAYEDCASVLNLEQKNPHPYAALLHSTVFYHAAIIKYKQSNFEKAAEHFSDFFKKIKVFCRLFLDNKAYQDLESKMVFDSVIRATLQDLKLCCQHSTSIFSAIYGDSHPFVKKFTLKNAIA